MQEKDATPPQVIVKLYDLVTWTCQHVARFPRSFRFSLGTRLETRLYEILEQLVEARYTRDNRLLLRRANLGLEQLRFQYRLARDLKCLSTKSYGHASVLVNEIGAQVGGWLKHSQNSRAS